MTWTRFWDICSGGDQQTEWKLIFIEADEEKAVEIFTEHFQR